MTEIGGKTRQPFLLPGIAAAVLLCLWCYATSFHAFDDDEFQHVNVAWLMNQGQRPHRDFFEHHLVLYHGLTSHLFRAGEGRSMIFVFRAISLISAGLMFLMLYRAGRLLGASRMGASAGIWLLGLTPMFLLKMTEARPEAPAMLAFAAAVRLLAGADDGGAAYADGRAGSLCIPPCRSAAIGLSAALMMLLSQKYAAVAVFFPVAVAVLYGRRSALWSAVAFSLPAVLYGVWMFVSGVLPEAFAQTVMLNLRWRYSFSPAGYLTELYRSAGVLTVAGLLGILMSIGMKRRRYGAATGILLAASAALIFLVPVPHRQSFLPLLAVLSLGAMMFLTPVFDYIQARPARAPAAAAAVFFLLGASSLLVLPDHLSADNRSDLQRMAAVERLAPEGPVFDGRKLMFWRPHVGRHACMHGEILLMIDREKYAEEVIEGLKSAGLPPVIRDYRVEAMPERILVFVEDHYMPSGIQDVYHAAVRRDRLMPGRVTGLKIPVPGHWRISWRGGDVGLGSEMLINGERIFLDAGTHDFTAEGPVWNLTIVRDYGGFP